MSGLFARMAQRARGDDAGAVRIRVPTPFEPEAPEAPEASQARTATAVRTGAPAAPGELASETRTRGERDPEPAMVPAPRGPDGKVSVATVEVTARAPATSPRKDQPTLVAIAETPRSRQGERDLARRDSPGEPYAAFASRASAPAPGEPANRAGDDTAAPQRATDAPTRDRRSPSRDDLLFAPATPRSTRARSTDASNTSRSTPATTDAAISDARPIVKVTIGRIDVRAAPGAPAAAAARPSRHQAMGLDEYLRRRDTRDGGGR